MCPAPSSEGVCGVRVELDDAAKHCSFTETGLPPGKTTPCPPVVTGDTRYCRAASGRVGNRHALRTT